MIAFSMPLHSSQFATITLSYTLYRDGLRDLDPVTDLGLLNRFIKNTGIFLLLDH